MTPIADFLTWVGWIDAALLIVGTLYGFYLWMSGIAPVLLRLGNGLARRKIAIYARGDNLDSLRQLLEDCGLFRTRNILCVRSTSDLECAKDASLYLVYWPDWSDSLDEILDRKADECALLVYQPYDQERIPVEVMKKLDAKRHTAVTNFRGRLLNDIVTSMITTS